MEQQDIQKLKKSLSNKKLHEKMKLKCLAFDKILDNTSALSKTVLLQIIEDYKISVQKLEEDLSVDNYIETVQVIKKQL